MLGGNNNYEYAPSPIRWIDVVGLQKKCYQTFYRDDSRSVTQMSKSHQANANGYQKSTDLIKKGDNDKLMYDHQEDSRNPLSPFISVTTNPKVAEYFATNEGTTSGTVYELKVGCGRARQNKFNKKSNLS